MTPSLTQQAVPLDSTALNRVAKLRGPCLTVSFPRIRPGAASADRRQTLRSLSQDAAEQVAGLKLAEAVPALKRFEEFAADLAGRAPDNRGFTVFCSAESAVRYDVTRNGPPGVILASHPYLRPFLSLAYRPQSAVLLCLSKKELRVFEYSHGSCQRLALPRGVPAGLEEAGAFDIPDHRMENRASAGPSVGTPGAVTFGTSSEREHRQDRLEHFLAMADSGIRSLLSGRPLLLAGVREDIAAFRRVSEYHHLLEADLDGNWDFKGEPELATAAAAALEAEGERLSSQAFAHFEQKLDRSRTLTDPREVLHSAADGRVHQLFFRRGAELMAKLGPGINRTGLAQEDLVNACACETLRHSGEVFELGGEQLPDSAPLAAILRY